MQIKRKERPKEHPQEVRLPVLVYRKNEGGEAVESRQDTRARDRFTVLQKLVKTEMLKGIENPRAIGVTGEENRRLLVPMAKRKLVKLLNELPMVVHGHEH
jgi:hypothetical protein